jgi:hypothetical protein
LPSTLKESRSETRRTGMRTLSGMRIHAATLEAIDDAAHLLGSQFFVARVGGLERARAPIEPRRRLVSTATPGNRTQGASPRSDATFTRVRHECRP